MDIHYKYSDDIPFCELADNYYPKTGKGKLKKISDDSEFPQEFCSLCMAKLQNLQLIKQETTQ